MTDEYPEPNLEFNYEDYGDGIPSHPDDDRFTWGPYVAPTRPIGSNTTSSAPILGLPNEILANIYDLLNLWDTGSLRQTCRELAHASYPSFGPRYFGELCVLVHPYSMSVLAEIARSPIVSRFVRKLVFSGEYMIYHSTAHGFSHAYLNMQTVHIDNGIYDRMLVDIFKSLTRLEAIGMDHCSYWLDYEKQFTRPGRVTIGAVFSPGRFEGIKGGPALYQMIFAAMYSSGVAEKVKLHLDIEAKDLFEHDDVRWLKHFAPQMSSLDVYNILGSEWFRRVFSACRNIEEMYLQAGALTFPYAGDSIVVYPKLSNIELHNVDMRASCLGQFMDAHCGQITHLAISQCGLYGGSWIEIFAKLKAMKELEHLELGYLYQKDPVFESKDFSMFDTMYANGVFTATSELIPDFVGSLVDDARTFKVETARRNPVNYRVGLYRNVDFRRAGLVVIVEDGEEVLNFREGPRFQIVGET